MTRPSLDDWLMGLAEHVAMRSSWPGTRVGCLAVRDGRIVSSGYNGTPRGWANDLERDAKEFFCHAEENTIVQAARYGISLEGCSFYLSLSPCVPCARMMVNAGAKEIVWRHKWEGHNQMLNRMFKDLGIIYRMG